MIAFLEFISFLISKIRKKNQDKKLLAARKKSLSKEAEKLKREFNL